MCPESQVFSFAWQRWALSFVAVVYFLYLRIYRAALSLGCCLQVFSSCGEWELLSSCGVWASPCSGFSGC